MKQCKQKGLTLIESMIVLAIVGLLVAVALTKVQQHVLSTRYLEVVAGTAPVKSAIEACVKARAADSSGALAHCAGSANSLPTGSGKYLASVTTTPEAKGLAITARAVGAMGKPVDGLRGESYVLQGSLANGQVTWAVDPKLSTCLTRSGGPICQ